MAALTVLTYHRVAEPDARPDLDPRLISATPARFERQVAWLCAHAAPLALGELLEIRRGRATAPRRAVLVTFDDAYRDFAETAWPLLRAHGIPVTLFVPTAFPDSSNRAFWWDRLHRALARTTRRAPLMTRAGCVPLASPEDRAAAQRTIAGWVTRTGHDEAMAEVERIAVALGEIGDVPPAVLGWRELRALRREGVTLAPHTRTHPLLHRVPLDRARHEIAGARADLVRETGGCPPAFAFPGGGHDEGVLRVLADEGFELGLTTERGPNDLDRADWLRLRRTNVGRRSTVPVLRAQLRPWPARAAGALAGARA
jgi:peptidoglycan/xylan/chitin deacetylase (PgdA/CDA1 family)